MYLMTFMDKNQSRITIDVFNFTQKHEGKHVYMENLLKHILLEGLTDRYHYVKC